MFGVLNKSRARRERKRKRFNGGPKSLDRCGNKRGEMKAGREIRRENKNTGER